MRIGRSIVVWNVFPISTESHTIDANRREKKTMVNLFSFIVSMLQKGTPAEAGVIKNSSALGLCSILMLQQFRNQFLFVRHRDLSAIDRKPFNAARIVPQLMDGHRLQLSNVLLFVG